MGMGQMAGGRGPGLGIVRGLEPGGSQLAQPTLHPRRPGSSQVGGLLWILSPAPEGVRSQQGGREGAGPAPTDRRGEGVLGAQPWTDPFSREAGRRAPLGPLRAPRTGPAALGAPRAGPQPREGQGPPQAVAQQPCPPDKGWGSG